MPRQTRTVLFTDIEGSTQLRTTHGDDAGDLAIAAHEEVVSRAVDRHQGLIVKGTGDGHLAIFTSARSGVAAAIAIQRDLQQRRRRSGGDGLRVRIGINAGEVRERDGDVFGEAVNAAARILSAAGGGEIVASRVVRDLVGTTDVSFAYRGEHELRGFPEPWQLYDVLWDGSDGPALPVQVRLFGHVAMERDGTTLRAFEAPRIRHLLARLVLARGTPVDRDDLAFELWPKSQERQARTNLSRVLHDLREALPELDSCVDAEGRSLTWRADAPVAVDVIDFSDAIEQGSLEVAADRYGGDFMPGWHHDWAVAQREESRAVAVGALTQLAREASERSDPATTIGFVRRLLGIDPRREDGYRLLMQAHALRGERAEALRAYHQCVEVLRRDLDVAPDTATEAAYRELRSSTGAATEPSPRASVVSTSALLIGRDEEWAQSQRAWNTALAGRATLLLVSGEPGIGKSRLVDELARFVGAAGHVVARARSYQGAGRLPWGPVVDWLRCESMRPSTAGTQHGGPTELGRLLPELRVEPEVAAAPTSIASSGRHALLDALADALAGTRRPTLLVIDDLQWCDADTIDVIGYLLHSREDAPVLIAGTARTEEIDVAHPIRLVMAEFLAQGSAIEIPLAPLDADATSTLAARLTGAALDEEAAQRLWDETEGNPLFLVEALRAGMAALPERANSPTVQAVIGARLAQISPYARSVAATAAVVGREFRVDVLAIAMSAEEDDLIDALDELWRRRIIREHATGYDFTHDRLREVAYDNVSPARRRKLHRTVADALAAVHGVDAGPMSAQLALHYEEGGLHADAVDAHRRAGEYALDVFAIDDAIASFRRALDLLERLPTGSKRDETELDLLVALGAPMVVREGYGPSEVSQTYERALGLCSRLGVRIDPAVLRGLGLASLVRCRFDRSMRFAQALLDDADDRIARVEGHYLMGVSQFWRGMLRESSAHLDTAIRDYRIELGPEHRSRFAQDPKAVCLVRRSFTMLWSGEPAGAATLGEEARRFAETIQHPATLGYVLAWSAMRAVEVEDHRALRECVETCEELCGRHPIEYATANVHLLRGWLDVLDERPKGMRGLTAAVGDWRAIDQPHLTYGLMLLARAHLRAGDLEAARHVVAEAIDWGVDHDDRWAEPELRTIEAELLARSGDRSGAERALRDGLAIAKEQHAMWPHRSALETLARLHTN